MAIAVAIFASLVLKATPVLLHYGAMTVTRRGLRTINIARHWGVLVGMGVLTLAQVTSIGIYTIVYAQLVSLPDFGQLQGEVNGHWIDYFYFSIMSYTTLGVGDIYPRGALRIISGLQALNGFAPIGWTASFAYALMRDGWES